ncbi:unnamed protein product, partial [Symbiodinium sp. CCMP2456]
MHKFVVGFHLHDDCPQELSSHTSAKLQKRAVSRPKKLVPRDPRVEAWRKNLRHPSGGHVQLRAFHEELRKRLRQVRAQKLEAEDQTNTCKLASKSLCSKMIQNQKNFHNDDSFFGFVEVKGETKVGFQGL